MIALARQQEQKIHKWSGTNVKIYWTFKKKLKPRLQDILPNEIRCLHELYIGKIQNIQSSHKLFLSTKNSEAKKIEILYKAKSLKSTKSKRLNSVG